MARLLLFMKLGAGKITALPSCRVEKSPDKQFTYHAP